MANWCCDDFHAYFARAGEAGLGILVSENDDDAPSFQLQHRMIDRADESALKSALPVAVVTSNKVSFCPWCGCRLSWRYQLDWKSLVRPELELRAGTEA